MVGKNNRRIFVVSKKKTTMNQDLTPEQKSFNDYLHANEPELMKKAYQAFSRCAVSYSGAIYGYHYKGYGCLHKDIYTLARHFENDYADFMGFKKPELA